jgi:hypothetical protein
MTWKSFHRRGEILRTVIEAADTRRDGILPMDLPGVRETFDDELGLLGALHLRWHTRLSGRIERELVDRPHDPEGAVVAAWIRCAEELPGVLAILDHYRSAPVDAAMAETMTKATANERALLAVMAGRAGTHDPAAAQAGAVIEERARAASRPLHRLRAAPPQPAGLLGRIRAALVA